jgi:hypothetical protein
MGAPVLFYVDLDAAFIPRCLVLSTAYGLCACRSACYPLQPISPRCRSQRPLTRHFPPHPAISRHSVSIRPSPVREPYSLKNGRRNTDAFALENHIFLDSKSS